MGWAALGISNIPSKQLYLRLRSRKTRLQLDKAIVFVVAVAQNVIAIAIAPNAQAMH